MARILSLIVSSWLVVPGVAAAAPDPTAAGREVDHALGSSHQRELPGVDAFPDDEPGDRVEREREAPRLRDRRDDIRAGRSRDPGDREQSNGPPAGPLSSVATMLLWGLVIATSLVLAIAVYRQLSGYTGEDEPEPIRRGPTDEQLAAVVERPRDDADELAAQGRFADAIHTLLLRTLHELASQNLVRVTRAMTSREILARVSLLGDAREGLAGLIVAVEQTWFGDDVPQVEDYQRCRAQFDRFAAAYRRGAGGRA